MIPIFETILPIFLLIVLGFVLRRAPLTDTSGWAGIEQISYWLLYPVLLFITIYEADFSGLRLDAVMATLLVSVLAMMVFSGLIWPKLRDLELVGHAQYSTVFQAAIRWNGFIALAVAQKLFPPEGMAVVALAMAVIIIPINVASIVVLTRFSGRRVDWARVARATATNPFILASVLALAMRALPFGIYEPVERALALSGSAALGMGLLVVGAGLRPAEMVSTRIAMWLPVGLKLVLFPAVMVAIGLALGLRDQSLVYLALCGAVPTSMNGFLMARQMGGDAELYAAVTTWQTAISFVSIPVVLALAAQIASG